MKGGVVDSVKALARNALDDPGNLYDTEERTALMMALEGFERATNGVTRGDHTQHHYFLIERPGVSVDVDQLVRFTFILGGLLWSSKAAKRLAHVEHAAAMRMMKERKRKQSPREAIISAGLLNTSALSNAAAAFEVNKMLKDAGEKPTSVKTIERRRKNITSFNKSDAPFHKSGVAAG